MSEFENPSDEAIAKRLAETRRIAVVGLSPKEGRPSHGVGSALKRLGFELLAVRPGTDEVMGVPAVPTLRDLPDKVDMAVVFRRPEHVAEVVDDAIAANIPALWLQDGVVDREAAEKARQAGLFVVMDRCIYRDGVPLMQAG
ncbi:putative CoA-binding protein [Natronospira proteinivora]|uniref:CoA-binding protein n=1 Tax=Natronospira proteinivora TaxID=1807133 RepID=A0ABT1G9X0_9GAMM|nr:CoA-binding protein [Natronospira proteinivora]MCP1728121.1 putative CoA-binding protein [Natronospira proteinivora]